MSRLPALCAAILAGGLCAAGTALWRHAHAPAPFTGAVYVSEGRAEALAVSPDIHAAAPPSAERTSVLRPEHIPFVDPDAARPFLSPGREYQVVLLPFTIMLRGITVIEPPAVENQLRVITPEAETVHAVEPGSRILLEHTRAKVADIRRWFGLWPGPAGGPMASLAVRLPQGEWVEPLLLEPGAWARLGGDLAISLSWTRGEAEAREAAARGLPGLESARWGVIDGGTVHWSTSFQPGSGMTLSDGRSVVLAQVFLDTDAQDARPVIEVTVYGEDGAAAQRVEANATEADPLLLFDFPAAQPAVFQMFAWPEGAYAAFYEQGALIAEAEIERGAVWTPEGTGYALRLSDVQPRAIPVRAEDSALFEAVLMMEDGRELRIREGESVPVGNTRLHYNRLLSSPAAELDLEVLDPGGGVMLRQTLRPGSALAEAGWRLEQDAIDPRHPDVAVLTAVWPAQPPRHWAWWGPAFAVGVAAAYGLARAMPLRRRASC